MIKNSTREIEVLFDMFDEEQLKALAHSTGFITRERNFTAAQFMHFLVRQYAHLMKSSLESLCLELDDHDIHITKSGLNKRLNWNAVAFLESLVNELFSQQIQKSCPTLPFNRFERIRVLDSTTIKLPKAYQDYFQGIHESSVKIHLELDVRSQQLLHYQLGNGRDADNPAGWGRFEKIEANELILQDLGYFQYDIFQAIGERGAFYLTKAKKDVQLFVEVDDPPLHPNGVKIEKYRYQQIDLDAEVQQMERGTYKEWPVAYAGRHKKLPVRCVIYRQSVNQEQETVEREKRRRQKKQGQIHKKSLEETLGITIYLTNIEQEIPAADIHEFYRLRWQIELLFKTWKSDLNVNSIKSVKIERWLCHFYIQLIVLFISEKICGYLKKTMEQTVSLSEQKTVREVATQLKRLLEQFWLAKSFLVDELERLSKRIRLHCQKSIKRT